MKKHGGSSEHSYSDHKPSMGHGSPKATHSIHGGRAGVPSELRVGAEPFAGSETSGKTYGTKNFEGDGKGANRGSPKGMKTYREE